MDAGSLPFAVRPDLRQRLRGQRVGQLSQVLTSHTQFLGVPVAAGGAIWALLVFMLAAFGLKDPKSETASRVSGYLFVLATLGLASVFYFGYVSFFVLKTACPICWRLRSVSQRS